MSIRMGDDIFTCGDDVKIRNFIHERLTDLLNYGGDLPTFNKYLETLRFHIWSKFGNRCDAHLGFLIMDGLHYDEYTLFKRIIKTIKQTTDVTEIDKRVKAIGEQLYQQRHMDSLHIIHYSFHGYINALLEQLKNKFTRGEITELCGMSTMFNRLFDGIGEWVS